MNIKAKNQSDNPALSRQEQLKYCFARLAGLLEQAVLQSNIYNMPFDDPEAPISAIMEKLVITARQERWQTHVNNIQQDEVQKIIGLLPVVAECKDGTFLVIENIYEQDRQTQISIISFEKEKDAEQKSLPVNDFVQNWTGGFFYLEQINTALTCFSIVAAENKIDVTPDRLIHEYCLGREKIEKDVLLKMGKDVGLKSTLMHLNWDRLTNLEQAYPVILKLQHQKHIVVGGVIKNEKNGEILLNCYDPLKGTRGGQVLLSQDQLRENWNGSAYLFKRVYGLTDESQPFSLRWFLPEILKQKRSFVDIALAVLFINIVTLITPIFFQIVIDKVLPNQALTTLHALGIGMTGMIIVNALLDFLRDYLLLHATNKIDLRVTGRTFSHMLQLPQTFFENVTAGVLTKHMQQTSSIRSFLTGSVFLTMLEATSLFIFVPFLFFYSFKLTALVLLFTCLIAIIMLSLIMPFKRRLDALYEAEGKRQAMLVETINGMQTVKSMAIEPLLRNKWEDKVAQAVAMQFRVGKISITAKSLTQFLERCMTVVLIWVGASQVFNGTLTVGALIAFQMLAGRVTSPLVRLVGLIHQYQEAALSVEKLGVVMNAKPEWGADKHGARPSLKGDIILDRVSFRYSPDLPDTLKQITLHIPAGSSLGIVGPSGSGKTTLTRLLQKAYLPTNGTIRINNCYLNELDTAHLRRNTGIVLQESFLFKASVADNIRAGQTNTSRQQIIDAAILAGADEFIIKLSQGYDTMLEEGASNLSGGQRQRLAIARALLSQPEILILDEATSALDPESEAIVRENLKRIRKGRTLITISHRLSMLKELDNIVVLQDGEVAGYGPHQSLLEYCDLYSNLWDQQMG